jgi:putative addiction module component (TIGR02574 family)
MSVTRQQELSQRTPAEKLLLVEDIGDEIAQDSDIHNFSLPDSQKKEMDRCYEDFLKNPEEGSPWIEVKKRLLSVGVKEISS